jgi:hypothetical protein
MLLSASTVALADSGPADGCAKGSDTTSFWQRLSTSYQQHLFPGAAVDPAPTDPNAPFDEYAAGYRKDLAPPPVSNPPWPYAVYNEGGTQRLGVPRGLAVRHGPGFDPVMYYLDFNFPKFFDGENLRVGRYISIPDIEAQKSTSIGTRTPRSGTCGRLTHRLQGGLPRVAPGSTLRMPGVRANSAITAMPATIPAMRRPTPRARPVHSAAAGEPSRSIKTAANARKPCWPWMRSFTFDA